MLTILVSNETLMLAENFFFIILSSSNKMRLISGGNDISSDLFANKFHISMSIERIKHRTIWYNNKNMHCYIHLFKNCNQPF